MILGIGVGSNEVVLAVMKLLNPVGFGDGEVLPAFNDVPVSTPSNLNTGFSTCAPLVSMPRLFLYPQLTCTNRI